MSQVIKRRCCNSVAIALALVWSVLVAYKAIDFVNSSGGSSASTHSVASIGSFYP